MKGYVRKRASGKWQYQVYIGTGDDGKKRYRTAGGFRTKGDAQEALREALGVAAGQGGELATGRLTLGQFVRDVYLPVARSKLSSNGYVAQREALEGRVLPRLGGLALGAVKPRHVAELYRDLSENGSRDAKRGPGLAPRTVGSTGKVLGQVFDLAVAQGRVSANPVRLVERPRVARSEMHVWSAEEARRFLAHVETDRLYALWRLLLATGMRRGEALGLRWSDVDLAAGQLQVVRALVVVDGKPEWSAPKTAASRRLVSLDPTTVTVLRDHRRAQAEERMRLGPGYRDDDLVFATVTGGTLHPDNMTKRLQRLMAGASVPRLRLHDLRHTAATLLLAEGVPLKVVSDMLGHSSIAITADVYLHVDGPMRADAAATLGAALDVAPAEVPGRSTDVPSVRTARQRASSPIHPDPRKRRSGA